MVHALDKKIDLREYTLRIGPNVIKKNPCSSQRSMEFEIFIFIKILTGEAIFLLQCHLS